MYGAGAGGWLSTGRGTRMLNGKDVIERRIRWGFRLFLLGLALLQVVAHRHSLGTDAVSYLDVADAYLRHDWHGAINTWWSPLYSWLLAIGLWAIRPSPFREPAVVQLVNFLIFIVVLISFEFFLSEYLPSGGAGLPRTLLVAWCSGTL